MAPLRTALATLSRRSLLKRSALAGGGLAAGTLLPARALLAGRCARGDHQREDAADAAVGRADRRPLGRSRDPLGARRPAGADDGDMGDHGESFEGARTLRGPAALEDADFTAKLDLAGLPPGQKIHYRVTMVDLADPKLVERAGRRQLLDAARRAPQHPLRLVGRHRGPGLGHQPRLGRHEGLRGDAPGRARVLHPFRRYHLRRRPDRGRGQVSRRQRLEERHHRGESQGRRDPRRVPRQLRLQPDGRARPALQRRGADARPVGRSRGHQQLVPGRGSGRRSEEGRLQGHRASTCWPRGRCARFRSTCRSAATRSSRSASTPPSATAPRSRSCGSTCAAIAVATRPTISRCRARTRRSSAPSRSAG